MATEDNGRMRSLFHKIVDLPVGERTSFLEGSEVPADARAELRALVEADLGAEAFLDASVDAALPGAHLIGQRFGPFETTDLLGRGGMGAVFKARRLDGGFAQTVAIKVIDRLWLDAPILERFQRERQL